MFLREWNQNHIKHHARSTTWKLVWRRAAMVLYNLDSLRHLLSILSCFIFKAREMWIPYHAIGECWNAGLDLYVVTCSFAFPPESPWAVWHTQYQEADEEEPFLLLLLSPHTTWTSWKLWISRWKWTVWGWSPSSMILKPGISLFLFSPPFLNGLSGKSAIPNFLKFSNSREQLFRNWLSTWFRSLNQIWLLNWCTCENWLWELWEHS